MKEKASFSWMSRQQKKKCDELEQQHEAGGLNRILREISGRDWLDARKQLYLDWYLEYGLQKEQSRSRGKKQAEEKRLGAWHKSSTFQTLLENQVRYTMDQFRIAGMVSTMCLTLVIYFLTACITGNYLVNFSVDAIAAALAAVGLIRYGVEKYRILVAFDAWKMPLVTDLLALALCILLKMLIQGFDLSLVVLLVAYWSEKKRFKRQLDDYRKTMPA